MNCMTIIVGDGPGGLSASLFLAKNGQPVTIFGRDNSPMHKAILYNYLGIPEMTGSEFQQIARQQVVNLGATMIEEGIVDAKLCEEGFQVMTDRSERFTGKYLILACGKCQALANGLGLEADETGVIPTDRDGRTSIKNLFVVGGMTRAYKSQAIIAAGDGAAAALAILSDRMQQPFHDYDVVSKSV